MDKMQPQRFEHKYIIPNGVALQIRDFVSGPLEVDEYGKTLPNFSYPVHSLYLDSPDLKLYQSTINGDKNRYKLRLRFYENRPDAPVYFEIKRRMNNTIAKQRGGVRREAVSVLLGGQLPEPGHMVSRDPRQLLALQRFCEHMNALWAEPVAHVAYLREAWLSPGDNAVRVTMDRQVRIELETTGRLETSMADPVMVFNQETLQGEESVVLELKFTSRYPDWFRDLVSGFGLMQCGAAKYVDGMTRIMERRGVMGMRLRDPLVFERGQRRLSGAAALRE
ncbi:MAG: polyphosphate polymerase domain-containing protein [Verrucomicrobia bacterium]|nr:polyphosphate polymerase domain-containing protein [Verrucomicrobiota bacterium]